MWSNELYAAEHPRGGKYFWLTGEYTNKEPECTDTDAWALAHGYVVVTPVTVDVTAYRAMDGLKDLEVFMKYYLIVGEASGDLHASHLMKELKARDAEADFRFLGET